VDEAEVPRGRPFMTARWSNLVLANFRVPAELLMPLLPAGLDLDQHDGSAWASLVAFDFRDTRVLGVPWPGYRNFSEVNLRFYVRHGHDRGVVFVREYVPLRLVAFLARSVYREPYVAARMSSMVSDTPESITIIHQVWKGGRENSIRATGSKPAYRPDETSLEHFFKEHRWGYGQSRRGTVLRYEIRHPVWHVYPVIDCELNVDWGVLYGPPWSKMNGVAAESVIIAVGSPVVVFPRDRISDPIPSRGLAQPLARPMPG
jgi:uncharacterized protein YqjF (DUF2071 family)